LPNLLSSISWRLQPVKSIILFPRLYFSLVALHRFKIHFKILNVDIIYAVSVGNQESAGYFQVSLTYQRILAIHKTKKTLKSAALKLVKIGAQKSNRLRDDVTPLLDLIR
jgi:hypothetical protein